MWPIKQLEIFHFLTFPIFGLLRYSSPGCRVGLRINSSPFPAVNPPTNYSLFNLLAQSSQNLPELSGARCPLATPEHVSDSRVPRTQPSCEQGESVTKVCAARVTSLPQEAL